MDDELLEIGRFSLVSGLSVPALRHYDDVGVLKPTEVDPRTSYRRYHPSQVDQARLICAIRAVDMPIDDVREVLAAADESLVRRCDAVVLRHAGPRCRRRAPASARARVPPRSPRRPTTPGNRAAR